MNVIAQLSLSQLKNNKKRTFWAAAAILLATALLTCVCSLAVSGYEMLTSFLGGDFGTYRSAYFSLLLIPAAVLGLIILLMAVIVISNVFRASAADRTAEFGMLKCVGATGAQIRKSILYEGAFLSCAAIPPGLLTGVLLTAAAIRLTNSYLGELNALTDIMLTKIHFELPFVLSPPALALSALIAAITVFAAARIPAKKAAAESAAESIRAASSENRKNSPGSRRSHKAQRSAERTLSGRIFGAEGFLAERNLSYNRKNFRATVSALTVGLILFTVVGSISGQVRDMSDMMYSYQTHSVTADYQSARIRQPVGGTEEYRTFYPAPIDSRKAQEITERLEEFDGDDVYGMGQEYDMYDAALRREQLTAEFVEACGLAEEGDLIFDAEIIVLDDEHYKKLCETHDIPLGSAILLNHISINENGHATDYVPFTSQLTELSLEKEDGSLIPYHIGGILYKEDIPQELFYPNTNPVRLIVESAVVRGYSWMHTPAEEAGYMNYAAALLKDYFPPSENAEYMEDGYTTRVFLTEDYIRIMNIAIVLALVLSFCFVGILLLIGFTNVISTLSANIMMRAREFAVFVSIGMTGRDLRKMLYLEGILCVLKAIIIGIPVSVAATYLINYPIRKMYPIPYELPLLPIAAYAAAVLAATVLITGLVSRKLRKQSVIETIRRI